MRRPDRAAVLPRVPRAARRAPSAVRGLLADVDFIRPPLCDVLGMPAALRHRRAHRLRPAPSAHPPAYDRARAVAHFSGAMRTLVHQFKYADRHDARTLFGRWLAEAGRELLAGIDVIVPVPLSRLRLLLRRFNQAAVLAQQLSRQTGVPMDPHAAAGERRSTKSQVGLTRDQRRRNVAGAFRRAPPSARRAPGPQRSAGRRRDHHGRHRRGLRPRPEARRRRPRRRAGPGPGHQRGPAAA